MLVVSYKVVVVADLLGTVGPCEVQSYSTTLLMQTSGLLLPSERERMQEQIKIFAKC
jgi:hypothetical protein